MPQSQPLWRLSAQSHCHTLIIRRGELVAMGCGLLLITLQSEMSKGDPSASVHAFYNSHL